MFLSRFQVAGGEVMRRRNQYCGNSSLAGAKAHAIFGGLFGTTEVMPCYKPAHVEFSAGTKPLIEYGAVQQAKRC
jgi:hypothetical protein